MRTRRRTQLLSATAAWLVVIGTLTSTRAGAQDASWTLVARGDGDVQAVFLEADDALTVAGEQTLRPSEGRLEPWPLRAPDEFSPCHPVTMWGRRTDLVLGIFGARFYRRTEADAAFVPLPQRESERLDCEGVPAPFVRFVDAEGRGPSLGVPWSSRCDDPVVRPTVAASAGGRHLVAVGRSCDTERSILGAVHWEGRRARVRPLPSDTTVFEREAEGMLQTYVRYHQITSIVAVTRRDIWVAGHIDAATGVAPPSRGWGGRRRVVAAEGSRHGPESERCASATSRSR